MGSLGAISASLNRLGLELAKKLEGDGASDVTGLNVNELASLANERWIINQSTRDGVEGLAVMHAKSV